MATAGKNLSEYDLTDVPNSHELRVGLVVAEWNSHITESLAKGAIDTLKTYQIPEDQIIRWNVPGTFELTYGCKKMAIDHPHLNAIIAIGSVIRGETSHFDFVCHGATQGITQLNIELDIPVIFCVLTDDNEQQSLDRSGGKHGNKGVEAAVAAVKMATLGWKP